MRRGKRVMSATVRSSRQCPSVNCPCRGRRYRHVFLLTTLKICSSSTRGPLKERRSL